MDACHAQPAGGVGRRRESEGLVLPWKPGNAGGGKEPWFWVLVRKRRVREIGMRLTTPPAIRTLQRKLYVKAKTEPTFRFYRLYDKVYRADILAHAYALAKANGGAPGVDGETFEQIESAGRADWLARLREDLRTRRYQPAAVRRVYIPKAGGVGERPLGIPTIRDRVVQTAAVLMLSPIFEAGFTDAMYGYRPRRSAQQAVAAVHEALGVCAAENGATIAGEIGRRKDLMSTTFRRYAPDQSLLLPPDVRAWLPAGHLAHHVSDLVDGLDLTAFYGAYAGDGRRNAPYEPRMMVKVLLYAYATGVFSSRGIARRLEEDVAFRVLAAGNFPQHRTVCEFRRRHLEDFKALFVEVVRLARELGLARFGKLSIDGTKVRANASKHKAMSYGRMQEEERRLAGEIDALVRAARDADAAEDERFGPDARGDELPSALRRREDRLAAIRAAKERLEAAQRAADDAGGRQPGQARNPKGGRPYKRGYGEPDEKAQSNFTDPESGIMKTSNDGFQQCYNAQVAVDGEHQLVVATEVTANASDQGGLPLLLDEVAETVGEQPDTVLADAGYSNERDLVNLETRGVDGYVSLGREGKTARPRDPGQYPATNRMAEKLSKPAGRAAYAERKWLSEAPHGWIKHVLGFRRFSLRGLAKVRGEWDLVCLALNAKRLHALIAA